MQAIQPPGYLPTGTGARFRRFADKHRERVSVLDFTGIDPTGATDSAAAFQAAVNSYPNGGPVDIPAGIYKLNSQITCRQGTTLHGAGPGVGTWPDASNHPATLLDCRGNANDPAFFYAGSNYGHFVAEDFAMVGPPSSTAVNHQAFGSRAFYLANFTASASLSRIQTYGFSNAFLLETSYMTTILNCHSHAARNHGLILWGPCSQIYVINSLFQNAGLNSTLATEPANIYVWDDGGGFAEDVVFQGPLVDEGAASAGAAMSSIFIKGGKRIRILNTQIYYPASGYGIRLGADCHDITIADVNIGPYDPSNLTRLSTNTIRIDAGATRVKLLNVTTDPNGGGDILDNGTDTLYQNVNGKSQFGVGGTLLTNLKLYTPSLSPVEVAANTSAEQLLTVSGLAIGDHVLFVNKPAAQVGLGIVGFRVSTTNTLAVTFANLTGSPITPTGAETYQVGVLR